MDRQIHKIQKEEKKVTKDLKKLEVADKKRDKVCDYGEKIMKKKKKSKKVRKQEEVHFKCVTVPHILNDQWIRNLYLTLGDEMINSSNTPKSVSPELHLD